MSHRSKLVLYKFHLLGRVNRNIDGSWVVLLYIIIHELFINNPLTCLPTGFYVKVRFCLLKRHLSEVGK